MDRKVRAAIRKFSPTSKRQAKSIDKQAESSLALHHGLHQNDELLRDPIGLQMRVEEMNLRKDPLVFLKRASARQKSVSPNDCFTARSGHSGL